MKKLLVSLSFAALLVAGSAQAQVGVAPVAALQQHLIARNYLGVNPATGEPTGKGIAALYFPFLVGIPEQFLFSSETVQDETTAHFTGVFSPITIEKVTTNGDMTNTFFAAGHEVQFYYDPTPNQSWTDFPTFKDGQHVATYLTTRNMISQIGNIGIFYNSAPLIFSADFRLPDGRKYNFNKLTPGGITVHVLASFTPVVDSTGAPEVAIVPEIGGPALMFPFSGTGIHQSPQSLTCFGDHRHCSE